MRSQPAILIVEDNMIVAEDIRESVQALGYNVSGIAISGEKALQFVKKAKPDIILMDIRLKGNLDGIETSKKIKEISAARIIYLTAHGDNSTLERAMETLPANYVLKPFNTDDLRISLLLVQKRGSKGDDTPHIVVRHKGFIEKVRLAEILFAKASGSYTMILTKNQKLIVSFNLNEFLLKVDARFRRVHRSYVVNTENIWNHSKTKLIIANHEIPIGRKFRQDFLTYLDV